MEENKFELEEKKTKRSVPYILGRAIGTVIFYAIALCAVALLVAVTAKLILRMF